MAAIFVDIRNRVNPLFIITVVVPTAIAILYFGIFASNVYVSESRFVVQSPEKAPPAGLGVILKSAGFATSNDEVSAAQSVVISRDALRTLTADHGFEKAYGSADVSLFDRFDAFGFDRSFEAMYRYFRKKVSLEHDSASSISTLTVRAYTPADAQRFNEKLLEMAEATVNRLNERGRRDLIRFATTEVADAEAQNVAAGGRLAGYRNRSGVVDPEKQAGVQAQLVSKLQDDLIATQTQLNGLRRLAPLNPQIPALQARAAKLTEEMANQTSLIAGSSRSLAATQARYEQLRLGSQLADKQLAGALTSLDEARNEARRKQAYVERIVQPNLPDAPLEPQRLRGILATLAMGLVAFGVMTMLLAGVREHKD